MDSNSESDHGHDSEKRDAAHHVARRYEVAIRGGRMVKQRDAGLRYLPATEESKRLADLLAEQSLEPLRRALAPGREITLEDNAVLHAPSNLYEGAELVGLTLTAACSSSEMEAATLRLALRGSRQPELQAPVFLGPPEHPGPRSGKDVFAIDLMHLVEVESTLWWLAGINGGPTDRIPYAYRCAAIEWIIKAKPAPGVRTDPRHPRPGVKAEPLATSICLRCGETFRFGRVPEDGTRCHHCTKESPATRIWPDNAIAPAGRGTWWLRCEARRPDCLGAFVGRRNRLTCINCRASNISPSKRHMD
jgi:hypothetical protein